MEYIFSFNFVIYCNVILLVIIMVFLFSKGFVLLFPQVKKKGKRKVIGVLDIYGFEIFKVPTPLCS